MLWTAHARDSERCIDAAKGLSFVVSTCCVPSARPDAPHVDITTLLHVGEYPNLDEGSSLVMKVPHLCGVESISGFFNVIKQGG